MDASRAAACLLFAACAYGCFLVPSPDDAWSDDYGAAPDAQVPIDAAPETTPEASACAASPSACVDCCDQTYGDSTGTNFFQYVFDCVCPSECASVCGGDCESSPIPSAGCYACLASAVQTNLDCVKPACGSTTCHGYMTCIGGCTP